MTILVPYAPTEDASDADKNNFYDLLEDTVRSVPPHDQLVIAGDLNAVSCTDRSGFEQVVGPFGSGIPNDNTVRFLTVALLTAALLLLLTAALSSVSPVGSWF